MCIYSLKEIKKKLSTNQIRIFEKLAKKFKDYDKIDIIFELLTNKIDINNEL